MSEELIQAVDLGSILGPPGPEGPQGLSLEFKWCGTKLGIRVQGQTEFSYVDLLGTPGEPGVQGEQGKQGIQGKSLEFKWCGTKLGIRLEGECKYSYVDLKGQQGNPGLIGPPGKDGKQGIPGIQGKSLEFKWNGTQLGIRVQGQCEYMYIDLQGPPGPPGPPGSNQWCDLEGVPETFPPSSHTHPEIVIPEVDLSNYYKKTDFEVRPIGNTPVKRDPSGGIHAEKLTTNVANVTHFDGGIVFRTSNAEGSNDLKVCNNPSAFKAWLNLGVKTIVEEVPFTTSSSGNQQANYTVTFTGDVSKYSHLQISGSGFKTFVVVPKTEGYTKLENDSGVNAVAIFMPTSNGFYVSKNGFISVGRITGIKYIEA